MKIKRFVAKEMRQALAEVTRTFGPDAVVMSSRRLPEGGVEVLAAESTALPAAEPAEKNGQAKKAFGDVLREQQLGQRGRELRDQLERLRHQESPRQESGERREAEAGAPQPDAATAEAGRESVAPSMQAAFDRTSDEVGQMRSELNGIRNLLQQRLGAMAWQQFEDRSPVQATLWQRLSALGIPASMSRDLLGRLSPDQDLRQAWRSTMQALHRQLPIIDSDPVADGGIFAFLGPTGAGKTTTIGKLATRYVLEHGPEDLALVTTDSHRIAAHEQLRALGGILGVNVRVVDQEQGLSATLENLSHKHLVLVDTAGMHPRDRAFQAQLSELSALPQLRKWLVLAATSQGRVLQAAWRACAPAGLEACVLSKLDEAGSLGDALVLLIEQQLPLVYEAHGQNIPDDIRPAHAQRLLSEAVGLARSSDDFGPDQERMLDEFARIWPAQDAGSLAMQMN